MLDGIPAAEFCAIDNMAISDKLPDLPVRAILIELSEALGEAHALLHAPPGSGKTTLAPLALLDAPWLAGRRILMLEPRRIAARAAARRMARLLGEAAGETVGFQTRFERRVSARTRIEVVTEGILTHRLQRDPALKGVAVLIFDEFHERSLHADLALALSRDVAEGLREDLRILVMSATLDDRALQTVLPDARLIACRGRQYPVEVSHLTRPSDKSLVRQVADAVWRMRADSKADLLVFLPGAPEIRRVERLLREADAGLLIVPLYGDLSGEMQDLALFPDAQGRQRVILATDIAETSLTIEGIDTVIDSGLCKRPSFDPNRGMSHLRTLGISRASADQRAGRAGRLGPGRCLRLWTAAEHRARLAFRTAEILHADLAPLALELLQWGVTTPEDLSWIDPPPQGAWRQAIDLLDQLGALDASGRLNAEGRRMARLPLHPRLASLVLGALASGCVDEGVLLAALLSERDILSRDGGGMPSADLDLRLRALRQDGAGGDRRACQRVMRVADQIRCLLGKATAPQDPHQDGALESDPSGLLARAFPDRIARRHAGGRYRLVNGRIAAVDDADPLIAEDYLVVAELDGGEREGRIQRAIGIHPDAIRRLFASRIVTRTEVRWRDAGQRFDAIYETRLGELVLSGIPASHFPAQAVRASWLTRIRRQGLSWLRFNESLEQWLARVNSLHHWMPESDWPLLDEHTLLARLDEWLGPWLEGVRTLKSLRGMDFSGLLKSLLDWDRQRQLERLAPSALRVPSGSRKRLTYASDGSPPVLRVRLQEMFGLEQTPTACDGRVAVMMHLLSPAQRPVQLTRDIAGFWEHTYAEVRKDLRGRYPKHHWPEDPRAAAPSARVKPR